MLQKDYIKKIYTNSNHYLFYSLSFSKLNVKFFKCSQMKCEARRSLKLHFNESENQGDEWVGARGKGQKGAEPSSRLAKIKLQADLTAEMGNTRSLMVGETAIRCAFQRHKHKPRRPSVRSSEKCSLWICLWCTRSLMKAPQQAPNWVRTACGSARWIQSWSWSPVRPVLTFNSK